MIHQDSFIVCYSSVHNAASFPFMHKHIESIWNLEHHHIKENMFSLLLKVGIFILPSLLPSPLLQIPLKHLALSFLTQ